MMERMYRKQQQGQCHWSLSLGMVVLLLYSWMVQGLIQQHHHHQQYFRQGNLFYPYDYCCRSVSLFHKQQQQQQQQQRQQPRQLLSIISSSCSSTRCTRSTRKLNSLNSSSNNNSNDAIEPQENNTSISSNQSSSATTTATNLLFKNKSFILSKLTNDQQSILSAMVLVLLDVFFRRIFQKFQIAFPSSLGGCAILLATLLIHGRNNNTNNNNALYNIVQPGATLLAKWLPVFFVPSLVTLPLVGTIGTPTEIAKIMAVIVGGFFFTLWTTSSSILQVAKLTSNKRNNNDNNTEQDETDSDTSVTVVTDLVTPTVQPTPPSPPPFSDTLMKQLRLWAIFTGIAALEGASPAFTSLPARMLTKFQTPVLTGHLAAVTLASFCYGARMPSTFKTVVHPLVTCTTLTWGVLALFGKCTGRTFTTMLHSYKMGHGWNGLSGTGAGDVFLFLLGPAVLSLAVSMYEKRQLVRDNAKEVATGVAVSSIGGLIGTAAMVRWISIIQPSLRVALLSRNITSPLAMAIASILGANSATVSLAVSIVVVTGLIGANFGATLLDKLGIIDPVARGMGIGAAAHGLGTAAFVKEKDAFPFAAISMALTATACTVLVSIPVIKKLVLTIALGGITDGGTVNL
ncbi:LrgB family protein [Nitzschia inconspicua]|uniref:LrgB family protein n=1 Tax=Nitzschia inconspicua TaxID=303405 RepID=A0A9K3KRR7_9STRA|nr:LrgB family protein [Nitzschia inconspicua]